MVTKKNGKEKRDIRKQIVKTFTNEIFMKMSSQENGIPARPR